LDLSPPARDAAMPDPEGIAPTADAETRLRRLLQAQQLLFRVSRELGPATEQRPVLDTVLRAMRDLVAFKGGSICLVEGDAIRLVVSDPDVSQEVKDLRLPVGSGLSGQVVATGEPIYCRDLATDPRVDPEVAGTGSNASIASWLGVPLVCLGEVTGLLQVDSATVDAFDDDDLYVLEGLGVLVAGAIESARRFEAVMQLERLKSDFIERVSHELRTPISIMSGFAHTLQDHRHELPEEERQAFVGRIGHASDRLRYLVEEIITVTSIDSGLSSPAPIDLSVRDAVEQALRHSRREAEVRIEVAPDLQVRTDPVMLEAVLKPLLDNAVVYAGGATVRAERTTDGVRIDVEDAGPGVDPGLRDTMFDRFTRGDHTVAGMGLGLAISRQVAGDLRGRIDYVPLDPGSRFGVVIPDLSSP
jgi:signal transduction histidine kinase